MNSRNSEVLQNFVIGLHTMSFEKDTTIIGIRDVAAIPERLVGELMEKEHIKEANKIPSFAYWT